ncbi:hypothetical protein BM756_16860 [Escherichia coli]|nr:hypothetical protein BM756_16860 [Escherichia coli]
MVDVYKETLVNGDTNTLKTGSADGCRIKDLKRLDVNLTSSLKDSKGRKLSHLAWLFDEPTVYKMH